jgi:hypothetical protein
MWICLFLGILAGEEVLDLDDELSVGQALVSSERAFAKKVRQLL